jgi:hypothetical protein
MGFTKITEEDLKSRGATTLPNQPAISAAELKREFDAPAKEIVAPKVNNLIDELEDVTAAALIGAVAPSGMTGNTVQAILNGLAQGGGITVDSAMSDSSANPVQNKVINAAITSINESVTTLQGSAHTHSNKSLLDTYEQTEANLSDAVNKKHSHSNKSLLDSYTQTNTDIADAVDKKHTHSNMSALNKLSEDSSGNPTYNGNTIPTTGQTGGFQKFIGDSGITPPSGSGELGDLKFYGGLSDEYREFYRYENDAWLKLAFAAIVDANTYNPFRKFVVSTTDIGEGVALDEDTIYLVYEA